jgi:uncharacterized protein (TIGR02246 family)
MWRLLGLVLLAAAGARPQSGQVENAVRAVLEAQQAAWNRGDVEGFMAGYEDSEATTFVGSSVTRGRARILERYRQRYRNAAEMGQLAFSELEIRPLCSGYAMVVGRWRLKRTAAAGGDAGGVFTLLFQQGPGGWKIVLDHTS